MCLIHDDETRANARIATAERFQGDEGERTVRTPRCLAPHAAERRWRGDNRRRMLAREGECHERLSEAGLVGQERPSELGDGGAHAPERVALVWPQRHRSQSHFRVITVAEHGPGDRVQDVR
jgi:hypothetical protein